MITTEQGQRLAWIEDGFLVLSMAPQFPWETYDIALSQLSDKGYVADWVWHLREKRWFTEEHRRQMVVALGYTGEPRVRAWKLGGRLDGILTTEAVSGTWCCDGTQSGVYRRAA